MYIALIYEYNFVNECEKLNAAPISNQFPLLNISCPADLIFDSLLAIQL